MPRQAVDGGLVESARASVNVPELRRYAHGLIITIDVAATTGEVPAGEVLRAGMQSQENGGPGPAVLRFRARLERGATASSLDHLLTPESEPEAPYLATLGGPAFRIDGNRLSSHQEL